MAARDYTDFFDLQGVDGPTHAAVRDDFCGRLGRCLQTLGIRPVCATRVTERLWAAMADPARHYHTAVHVLAMFDYAADTGLELTDTDRAAIWFHDGIYDASAPPGRNEADSAQWMRDALGAEPVAPSLLDRAAEVILGTAAHHRDDARPEHRRVMDLDLAGFTAPPEVFARQSAALRLEYPHLSDADYARGTAEFLRGLLARRRLFYTPPFRAREPVAREQIRREIERLECIAP